MTAVVPPRATTFPRDATIPKPWPRWLPAAVFGVFLALSVVELAFGLARAPRAPADVELPAAAAHMDSPGAAK